MVAALTPEQQDERYMPLLDDSVGTALDDYEREGGFHIRQHGEGVVDRTQVNRLILLDSPVKEVPGLYTTTVAAGSHDRGFHRYYLDPKLRERFPSAEAYATYLTDQDQKAKGVDVYTRREIGGQIMGTKAGMRCRTWGEFIVCEADVHTTTLEDTTQMDSDTDVLQQEYARLVRDLGRIGYRIFSFGILATIHQVNLNFSRIQEAGDVFVKRREQMGKNLASRWSEIVVQSNQDMKDLVGRISPPFLGPVLSFLGIEKPTDPNAS